MIEKPTNGNWFEWVNRRYPFDDAWERHLLTRTERPQPCSEEQLDDLRGIVDRSLAAMFAELWFHSVEKVSDVERAQRLDREKEREKERCRMVRTAKLALESKLGDTREERDSAQATAQHMLGNGLLEQLGYNELRDWERMHRYARAVARGDSPPRPTLWRERKRESQQRRELEDIDGAIGAIQAWKPRTQYEQQELGQFRG
jgi:hypothetical protein